MRRTGRRSVLSHLSDLLNEWEVRGDEIDKVLKSFSDGHIIAEDVWNIILLVARAREAVETRMRNLESTLLTETMCLKQALTAERRLRQELTDGLKMMIEKAEAPIQPPSVPSFSSEDLARLAALSEMYSPAPAGPPSPPAED